MELLLVSRRGCVLIGGRLMDLRKGEGDADAGGVGLGDVPRLDETARTDKEKDGWRSCLGVDRVEAEPDTVVSFPRIRRGSVVRDRLGGTLDGGDV